MLDSIRYLRDASLFASPSSRRRTISFAALLATRDTMTVPASSYERTSSATPETIRWRRTHVAGDEDERGRREAIGNVWVSARTSHVIMVFFTSILILSIRSSLYITHSLKNDTNAFALLRCPWNEAIPCQLNIGLFCLVQANFRRKRRAKEGRNACVELEVCQLHPNAVAHSLAE